MARMKLTAAACAALPHPERGQALYWDKDQTGLGLLVGRRTKTFVVQHSVAGRTVRTTIGRLGDQLPSGDQLTARTARVEAARLRGRMASGENPNERARQDRAGGITLAEALDLHLAAPRVRSPRTVEGYRATLDRYFPDWKDRPLADLTRKEIGDRHRDIGVTRGEASANGAFRVLRACWKRARRRHPELDPEPLADVDWYENKIRDVAVAGDGLPDLWHRITMLENPIRRDLYLFLLLTGMRRAAACAVRWEDVDTEARTLRVPKPKGGEKRAFKLPLSGALLQLLAERRACLITATMFPESAWVFPAQSASGHVEEPREATLPMPHALRHTFITSAVAAGVGPYEIKLLVNHALPRADVTGGYVGGGPELLRPALNRVDDHIMERAGRWCRWPKQQSDLQRNDI